MKKLYVLMMVLGLTVGAQAQTQDTQANANEVTATMDESRLDVRNSDQIGDPCRGLCGTTQYATGGTIENYNRPASATTNRPTTRTGDTSN